MLNRMDCWQEEIEGENWRTTGVMMKEIIEGREWNVIGYLSIFGSEGGRILAFQKVRFFSSCD